LMDAESEKAQSPELLLEGFFDAFGYIDQIVSGNKFYIFGQKGSGKSAIGSRIELIAKNDPNFFVNQHYLGRFEYKKFSELFPGSEAPESRYPTHWEFILLITLLNNLKKDIQCKYESEADFYSLLDTLDQINVIPDKDFAEIVKITSKRQFSIKIFKMEHVTEKTENVTINTIFSKLKKVCYTAKTPNKHIIIVDGLDIILTHRQKQYQTLSALLIAVNNFNNKLVENGVNAKIVVLCRTDLLNKIADPNSNKFIQNFGIFLNWYQDKKDIHSTNLVKLINRRVALALKNEIDISEFLPSAIESDKESLKVLLDHTRHIPRDLIQLLNKIQNHTSGKNPSMKDINNGIDEYSNVYFVRELQDTLVGFLDDEEKGERVIQLLGAMGTTQFSYRDIEAKIKADPRFSKIDLTKTMDLLFDSSAIGNINSRTGFNTWKYRNLYALFDPNQIIVVHKGLHKALNLRYERTSF